MDTERAKKIIRLLAFAILLPGAALAAEEVSTIVAVKGTARIEREKAVLDAKVKDPILIVDTVSTMEASRAKMLFRDDSVLTLGEKSRVSIKEYVQKNGELGRSVFNLLDGKLKAVVGRTKFEVHSPTAVAAARGTVILFETGVLEGKQCTGKQHTGKQHTGKQCTVIVSQEGEVSVKSASTGVKGEVTLTSGQSIVVVEGEPLSSPVNDGGKLAEQLTNDTDMTQVEIAVPSPGRYGGLPPGPPGGRRTTGPGGAAVIGPLAGGADGILSPSDGLSPVPEAHIQQQAGVQAGSGVPAGANTPVNINLNFR